MNGSRPLDCVFLTDFEGHFLDVSQAALDLLGYAREEIATLTFASLLTDDQLQVARQMVERILTTGHHLSPTEYRLRTKDGKLVSAEIQSALIYGEGKPLAIQSIARDITEHKVAEDLLRESEQSLRESQVIAGVGSYVLNVPTGYWKSSAVLDEILGIDATYERSVEGWAALVHSDDQAMMVEYFRNEVLGQGRRFDKEYRIVRHDNQTVRWVHGMGRLEIDTEGRILNMHGTIQDITERKQAEESLRESEERYRALFDRSLFCVYVFDLNGRFLDANQTVLDLLGYHLDEFITLTPESLLTEDQFPRFRQRVELNLSAGGQLTQTEWRVRRKDGGYVFLETVSAVIYREGKPYAIQSVGRDVTERKQAEDALRLTQFTIDHASEAIFWTTPDARIVDVNQAACQSLGYTREQLLRLSLADVDAHHNAEGWPRRFAELRQRGSLKFESAHRTKDGRLFPVEIVANHVRFGAEERICGFVRDITERKRAEEEKAKLQAQLHQSMKMEAIGRLAGGIAHDFNNLLTVINGYSQLELRKLSEGEPLRDALAEIHKAGERAVGLTRQLLAFSRKQVLQPRVLDLNRVVQEMRPMLERLVGEDVEVRVALDTKIGTVHADPNQVEQVIMNLAVNARDAMPGGGWLLIETVGVELEESYCRLHPEVRAGRYVVLTVGDSGTGIDEATRQRIFEPFFTTKPTGQGTGLGLSMVQGIVAQSGGHISVHSETGRGTTFRIYLPALAETATDPAADAGGPGGAPALGGRETVLVVEDLAEVREYAIAALKAYGYRVIEAGSAGEALRICEQEHGRIHLVLTDVVMPNLGGLELARRLEELSPGTKVLLMSGYTDHVTEVNAVLDDRVHFIEKPFSPEELARRVRAVLGPPTPLARVLVADDEAGVRSFVRAVLEPGGYEVIEAANGKQALDETRAGQVDLVLTDLVMPEQEGIETIRALRKDVIGIGIIAMSGAFSGEFLEVARKLGAQGVLSKPLRADLLLAKVAEVLKSRR